MKNTSGSAKRQGAEPRRAFLAANIISKKCNAIEHGSSSYHRGADDPQDQIYVKGGNYPETGDKFVPYTIAYDEQPILTGTMPDGSAAIWQ